MVILCIFAGNKITMPQTENTQRKNLDIENHVLDAAYRLALKEKRRGKKDPKNFMEDLITQYVIEHDEELSKKNRKRK